MLIAFAAHDRQISANMVLAAVIAPSADPYAAFRLCELEVLTRPAGGASSQRTERYAEAKATNIAHLLGQEGNEGCHPWLLSLPLPLPL